MIITKTKFTVFSKFCEKGSYVKTDQISVFCTLALMFISSCKIWKEVAVVVIITLFQVWKLLKSLLVKSLPCDGATRCKARSVPRISYSFEYRAIKYWEPIF